MANDVWTAHIVANWNTAADWSLGVPTSTSHVVINSGIPDITTDVSIASLTLASAGTLTIGAGLTISSGMTVNAGTLNLTSSQSFGFTVALGAGATKIKTNGNTDYFNGIVSGSGSLSVSGGGAVALDADNTFSGGVTVAGGILAIFDASGLGSGALTLENDAQFQVGGDYTLANAITLDGPSQIFVQGGDAATLNGNITDGASAGSLLVNGPGTLVLGGDNTYSGGTEVEGGSTLKISADDNYGTGAMTLDGGSSFQILQTLDDYAATTLNGSATIFVQPGQAATLWGNLTDGASAGSLIVGGGTLALEGSNTYSGGTEVLAGATLKIAADDNYGTGPMTLDDGSSFQILQTLDDYAATTLNGSATIFVQYGNAATMWGVISDGASAGALIVGGDTLVLEDDNTYSGGTEVLGGATLKISADDNIGSGPLTLDDGSTLVTTAGFSNSFATTLSGGTATINVDSQIVYFNAVIGGAGALVAAGSGALALDAANTFAGGVTAEGNILAIFNASGLGTGALALENDAEFQVGGNYAVANAISLDGPSQIFVQSGDAATLTGNITDSASAGSLLVNGPGTLVLVGDNTYSGGTEVAGGSTLKISADDNYGTGAMTLDAGSQFQILQTIDDYADITLNGAASIGSQTGQAATFWGTISDGASAGKLTASGGTVVLEGDNTYSGGTEVANGVILKVAAGDNIGTGTLTLDGGSTFISIGTFTSGNNVALNGAAEIYVQGGDGATLNGVVADGAATGSLKVAGNGALVLQGANTYTGGTEVLNGAILKTFAGNDLGTGTLTLDGGSSYELDAAFTLANAIALKSGKASLTVTTFFDTLSGAISGAGGMNLTGGGGLILAGANTFTGGIADSGTTLVTYTDSALGAGTVALSGGANIDFSPGGAFTVANKITVAGTSNFFDPTGNTATLTGVIANSSSAGAITTNSNGVLVFAATNTYSGGTTINAGELELTNVKGLGSGGLTFGGGGDLDLGLTGAYANAISIGSGVSASISADAGVTATLNGAISGSGPLTLTGAGKIVVAGAITTGANGLTMTGTGTAELKGVDTYTGATTVSSGTLQLAGASSIYQDDAVSVASGATLAGLANVTIGALSGAGTVTEAGAMFVGSGNASSTFSGVIKNGSTTGSLYKVGSGKLSLGGVNTFTGGITLEGGTLSVSNLKALSTGNINFFAADDALEAAAAGTVANGLVFYAGDSGTIEAIAGKTLTLTGSYNDSGSQPIGTIHFGSATDTGTINLKPSSVLATVGGAASVDGGSLLLGNANAATLLSDFNAVNVGSTTTSATLNLEGNNTSVFNLTGSSAGVITDTGAATTLSVFEDASTTFGGSLKNGSGVLSLDEVDTGSTTLTLTGVSTYTGATTIGNDQTLALSGAGAIAHTAISLGLSADFDITGLTGGSSSVLSLSGASATSSEVNLAGKTLNITAQASSPILLFEGSTGSAASHLNFDTAAANFSLASAMFGAWANTHNSIVVTDSHAGATIVGASQNDQIYALAGDHLTGGGASDGFMFNAPVAAGTISNFSAAQGDYIGISHTGFSALGLSAGQALPTADFTVGSGPSGTNAQFVWNSATSTLSYAPSGTSGTNTPLETLTGVTTLTASNIHIF